MKREQLRVIRKAKKITQAEMAKHLGISRELFGLYEQGKSQPRLDILLAWCSYIGVEIIIREI